MQNSYTQYLLNNSWREIKPMLFQHSVKEQYEIFFDNSNVIEFSIYGERKADTYLNSTNDLIAFLKLHTI